MTQTPIHPRRERGQGLAEFSLVLPVLLMVVFGIIDFGRVLFVFSDASGSLRDASRNAEILGYNSSTNTPTYADCDLIIAEALSTRFVGNEVVDVYYFDTTDPAASGLTSPADWDVNNAALLADAHYACDAGTTIPSSVTDFDPSADSGLLSNGDILRVHYTGRVEFLTPFLNAIWSGIDIDFYTQRSVVTKLTLGASDGIDYDYDGLDDRWEFMWWGCTDGTTDYFVDANWLFAPVSTWESWTVTGGSSTSVGWESVCDFREVTDPNDSTQTVKIPKEINVDGYNAIADIDLDDCNNGCEETRNTQPTAGGEDTDGDGVNDGVEANSHSTSGSGGDIYACTPANGGTRTGGLDTDFPADGVPDGYDTDCDGVPDGVELGYIEPYDDGTTFAYRGKRSGDNGLTADIPGYPFSASEARYIVGADGVTYDGGIDSDGDGLTDHEEYYWIDTGGITHSGITALCSSGWGGSLPIEAAPYECHASLTTSPGSWPINGYRTNPTHYDISPDDGVIDGLDTDSVNNLGYGDNLTDYEEIEGFEPGFAYVINTNTIDINIAADHTYYSDPNLVDSDGDGLTDQEERTNLTSLHDGGGFTDPMNPDTDGDGFSDGYEVNNGIDPLKADADDDGIKDGDEASNGLNGTNIFWRNSDSPNKTLVSGSTVIYEGYDTVNLNIDLGLAADTCYYDDSYELVLGIDPSLEDTDGDGLSDCDEIAKTGTDPTLEDSDNDTFSDLVELQQGSDPLDITITPDTVGPNYDVDNGGLGDGLPDWWEQLYYGDENLYDADDDIDTPTPDGCNNLCEYLQGTDPTNPDTDGDGLGDNDELPASSPTDEDTDDDGLWDGDEASYTYNGVNYPLDARTADSDEDGLLDGFEVDYGITTIYTEDDGFTICELNAADADTDGDGLDDNLEVDPLSYSSSFTTDYYNSAVIALGADTNPCRQDTDGDGWTDYAEIFIWSKSYSGIYRVANPEDVDTDNDGIRDALDSTDTGTSGIAATDFWDPDSDDDGLRDGDEFYAPLEPDRRDPSGVARLDGFTLTVDLCGSGTAPAAVDYTIDTETSPVNPDSDGDGLMDGIEVGYVSPGVDSSTLANLYSGDNLVSGLTGVRPNIQDTDSDGDWDGVDANPNCDDDSTGGGGGDLDCGGDPVGLDPDLHSDCDEIEDTVELAGPSSIYSGKTLVDDEDSDNDGIDDDIEAITGYVLASPITWKDELGASQQDAGPIFTNPTYEDLNGDGAADGIDTDLDSLGDLTELTGISVQVWVDCNPDTGALQSAVTMVTHPAMRDTDGDGMPDNVEIDLNVDPLDGECGPELIKDKINADSASSIDEALKDALDYHWRTYDDGTVDTTGLTQSQATLFAINLLASEGWDTGLSSGSNTFEVGFGTGASCPSGNVNSDPLKTTIEAAATTWVSRESQNGTAGAKQCFYVVTVTFDQFLDIIFWDEFPYAASSNDLRFITP